MNTKANRIIFGHWGQFGDLFMNEPFARHLKKVYPDYNLYMAIYKKYVGAAPLFFNHNTIDGIHVSNECEVKDLDDLVNNLKSQYKNIGYVFNPMQLHRENYWFTKRHQVKEVAYSYYQIKDEDNYDCQIKLNQWWTPENWSNTIAFHPFPGAYQPDNTKSMKMQRCQEIVDLLVKEGYKIIQVGGEGEPQLKHTQKINAPFYESIKIITNCKAFIGFDSGLTWALSGYEFPTLAMYSNEFYTVSGTNYIKNIQPINKNAIYLDDRNVNDIILERIKESLNQLL